MVQQTNELKSPFSHAWKMEIHDLQVANVKGSGIFERILRRLIRLLVVGHLCIAILLISIVAIIPAPFLIVL